MTKQLTCSAFVCVAVSIAAYSILPDVLELVPGVGVPGRAEVGMIASEFAARNPDAIFLWERDTDLYREQGWTNSMYSVTIPSLSVSFWAPDDKYPVDSLDFFVYPAEGVPLFEGKIKGGPSFTTNQAVCRAAVTNAFGEPTHMIISKPNGAPPDGLHTNLSALLSAGYRVSWDHGRGSETLYYPRNGVVFNITCNRVERIVITKTRGKSNQSDTSNPRSPSAQGSGGR